MLIDELQLAPGSMRDYAALAAHHYRAARPATATRVFTLRHPRPTVVDRFLQRVNPARVVAVLVESMPALNCRLRDYALDNRYGFWKDCRQRAAILNAELRCISRVIVHPQWRGLGLAGKLVRAALDSAPTRYTEALAAMGNVHPFFERAGMIAYRRPAHEFDQRLATALQTAGFEPVDLALLEIRQRASKRCPPRNAPGCCAKLTAGIDAPSAAPRKHHPTCASNCAPPASACRVNRSITFM